MKFSVIDGHFGTFQSNSDGGTLPVDKLGFDPIQFTKDDDPFQTNDAALRSAGRPRKTLYSAKVFASRVIGKLWLRRAILGVPHKIM
jgi:hypothetical protein